MPENEPFDDIEPDWFDTLYYSNEAYITYSKNNEKNIRKYLDRDNLMKIAHYTETKVNGNDWEECLNTHSKEYETEIISFIECPYNIITRNLRNSYKTNHYQLMRQIEREARFKYELFKERSCFKNGGLKYKYKE